MKMFDFAVIKRLLRWTVGAALLLWVALAANAFQYFHRSGGTGVFYSAYYAVAVLRVPNPAPLPDVPEGYRLLRSGELRHLTSDPSDRPKVNSVRLYTFTGPNDYRFNHVSSDFPFTAWGNHFIYNNSVCLLNGFWSEVSCMRVCKDMDGRLMSYDSEIKIGDPSKWQALNTKIGKHYGFK